MRLRGGKRSLAGMPGLIPDADPGWETALLLPVPAAEPAVSHHRAQLDEAARDGVPAHVTVPLTKLELVGAVPVGFSTRLPVLGLNVPTTLTPPTVPATVST